MVLPPHLAFRNASFIDLDLNIVKVGSFDGETPLQDPFSGETINGEIGHQLFMVQYPIGSVVSGGPPLTVDACLTISAEAAIGIPLTLTAQPIYQFGNAPTGDTPIFGQTLSGTITPSLIRLEKKYLVPEGERPPEDSFPFETQLTIDVANGKTVYGVQLTDIIPAKLRYAGLVTLSGQCNLVQEPSDNPGAHNLTITCASIEGTTADEDAILVYRAHVRDILDEQTCDTSIIGTTANLQAQHPINQSLPAVTAEHQLTAKHVTLQKTPSKDKLIPGETFSFVLDLQITDYATVNGLALADSLPDGLTFTGVTSSVFNGNTYPLTATVTPQADGGQQLDFDLHALTGDLPPGSVGRIVYAVEVDQSYDPQPDPLLATDPLATSIAANYSLVEGATGNCESSAAQVRIRPIRIEKSIVSQQSEYLPGETVTFLLEAVIPSGDTENLRLSDFLPLPVFQVADFSPSYGANVRTAPHHSLDQQPQITTHAATNSMSLQIPAIHSTQPQTLALEVDVVVTDDPFRDDLYLTNLIQASADNSYGPAFYDLQGVSLRVRAPKMNITKGVSQVDNPQGVVTPTGGQPVDGDLSQVDAGDRVTFVVTLENQGGAPAYAVTASEEISPLLEQHQLVSVTDGQGRNLAHSGDLFGSGLILQQPLAANQGLGAPFGEDTALITFSASLSEAVTPNQVFETLASATWSAGPQGTPYNEISDQAEIVIAEGSLGKTIAAIAPNPMGTGMAVAGDVVTYNFDISLPEGTTSGLTLIDSLPPGLALLPNSLRIDTGDFAGGGVTGQVTAQGSVAQGQQITVVFNTGGAVRVNGNNQDDDNRFSVEIDARLEGDSAANQAIQAPQNKRNQATLSHDGEGTWTDAAELDFIEADLDLVQSLTPSGDFDGNDPVTLFFQVTNQGTATAFDVVLTSTLNQNGILFDLATLAEGITPDGFTFSFENGELRYSGSQIAVAEALTFSVTAKIHPDVLAGATYTNTISVQADSQQGNVSGERDCDDSHRLEVTARAPAVTKSLIASDQSFTQDNLAAVGEVLTFELVYTLPEGRTLAAAAGLITDDLPNFLSYVPGSARLSVNAQSSLISEVLGPLPTTPTAMTPGEQNGNLTFDLGDLTNEDDDADVEALVITYDVLVRNSSQNNRGNTKTNTAAINYLNLDGNPQSQSASASVVVGEPKLRMSQTANPMAVVGGSQVTFTLRLKNTNQNATTWMWEPEINDVLPARLLNPAIVKARTSRHSDLTSCVAFDGAHLNWQLSDCVSADDAYLQPGEWMEVVFTATVDPLARFEESITNVAEGSASSLPGQGSDAGKSYGERTGSGIANELDQSVNDLRAAKARTLVVNRPVVTKTGDADLPIGQTTAMQVSISVPVGTTDNFVLTDQLPSGLRLTGAPIQINLSSPQLTVSQIPNGNLAAGTNPLVFSFGEVINSGNQSHTITIDYQVEVENVLDNQDNSLLINQASLAYTGVTQPPPADTATIRLVEPNLMMEKLITAGAAGSDAGDTITYQLSLRNTNSVATAHRVELENLLPQGLLGDDQGYANVTLSLSDENIRLSDQPQTPLNNDHAFIYSSNHTNDSLGLPPFDLPPAAQVVLTWTAQVRDDAIAGSNHETGATAHYQSLPGGGREGTASFVDDDDDGDLDNYRESARTELTLNAAVALQKTLSDLHVSDRFTIGETLTFDLRLSLVEGISQQVYVRDTLPQGLELVNLEAIEAPPHFSYDGPGSAHMDNGEVVIPLGTVTNLPDNNPDNDHLTLKLSTRILDRTVNQDGRIMINTAQAQSLAGISQLAERPLTIIEPALSIEKTADSIHPSLGDLLTYTITVQHVDSSADAYDLVITDPLPSSLTLIPESISGPVTPDLTDPTTPVFQLGTLGLNDGTRQFSFQVRLEPTASTNSGLTNQVNATYASLPAGEAEARQYQDEGQVTVYPAAPSFIQAVKTVAVTTDQNNDGLAQPDDVLTYTIELHNEGPTVTGVTFVDPVPLEVTYVSGSLATSAGTVQDGNTTELKVDLGTMAADERVTIQFEARVNDVPAGTEILNQGVVDSSATVPEPTDVDGVDSNGDQPTVTVVGSPQAPLDPVYLWKTAMLASDNDNNGLISAGDTLRYDLVLTNLADQVYTGVVVRDDLPPGLTLAENSGATQNGTVTLSGNQVTWQLGPLAIKANAALSFEVTIDDPLYDRDNNPDIEVFPNQATAALDGVFSVPSDSNGDPSDGYQKTQVTALAGEGSPRLDLEKRWSLVQDRDGNGLVNPGDTLSYRLSMYNLGAREAENVRITDDLPPMTTLVAGSVITDTGVVIGEQPVSVNLGTIPAGGVGTVRFEVTVNAEAAGQVIANQAQGQAHNTGTLLSDDNGFDGDGQNPTLTPVEGAGATPGQLVKTVLDTSLTATAGMAVHIGEEVDFEIRFSLPPGTSHEVVMQDSLPAGLTYVPGSASLAAIYDTGLRCSQNPGGINGKDSGIAVQLADGTDLTLSGQNLQLFLGDVINSDQDADAEQLVLSFRTRLANAAVNTEGQVWTNTGRLNYRDELNQSHILESPAQALTIHEPQFSLDIHASPATLLSVGGEVEHSISLQNTSTTTAFDLTLALPWDHAWESATLLNLASDGCTGVSLVDTLPLKVVAEQCEAGGTVQVQLKTLANQVDQDLVQEPKLTWTSLPGPSDDERTGNGGLNNYHTSAQSTVAHAQITMAKVTTSNQSAIGQIHPFTLTLWVPPQTTLTNALFIDTPDTHLAYVAGSMTLSPDQAISLSAAPTEFSVQGNALQLDFGTLTNSSQNAAALIIEYAMETINHLAVQQGTVLGNAAALAFDNPSNGARETLTAATQLQVVEPQLQLSHDFLGPYQAMGPGESTQVEITLANTGTGTAYDVVLWCPKPDLIAGFANFVISDDLFSVTADENGWTSAAFDLAPNATITLVYTLTTVTDILTGGKTDLTATAWFSSLAGDEPGERDGSDGFQADNTALNNYQVQASTRQLAYLSVARTYAFEDLKHASGNGNDFDYNDVVLGLALNETIDDRQDWTRLDLDCQILARGAAYHHEVLLDVGISGPVEVNITRYDPQGQVIEVEDFTSQGEFLADIRLFEDSWTALPPWGSAFANTQAHQPGSAAIVGARTTVTIHVLDPQANPRVADDHRTQHLNEMLNYLVGPRIYVKNTGETIQARWRLGSATQDIVSADIYGADTPLLGFPLDQALDFAGDWMWPVEVKPVWESYPRYISYTYSGKTAQRDWDRFPSFGQVWPVDQGIQGVSRMPDPPVAFSDGTVPFPSVFEAPLSPTPALGDVTGDGWPDVVAAEYLNQIAVFDGDGQLQALINPDPNQVLQSPASPALADLDGDGVLEIIRGYDNGTLYAFHGDGTLFRQWQTGGTLKSSVAVGDIDGDQTPDLVVLSGDNRLYAFGSDGSTLNGFPVTLKGQADTTNNFVLLPTPALIDFNADSRLDIVAVTNTGMVAVVDGQGQYLPGWPVELNETVISSPSVGDLDGDRSMEIAVAADSGSLLVLGASGQLQWWTRRTLGGPSSPTLGDLDGDGFPEIVVGSLDGKLYAWNRHGNPMSGWPVTTASQIQGSPAVVDIDEDGRAEVFVGSFDTQVHGFNGSGIPLSGNQGTAFPKKLDALIFASPVLADVDADGLVDLVVGTHNRQLYKLSTKFSTEPGNVAWGQFRGDAQRAGRPPVAGDPVLQIIGPRAQGLQPVTLSVKVLGATATSIQWRDGYGDMLAEDLTQITLPMLFESEDFRVTVSIGDLVLEQEVRILVAFDDLFQDIDGDGCNTPEDFNLALGEWGTRSSLDADNDGWFSLRDLMYINTADGCQ